MTGVSSSLDNVTSFNIAATLSNVIRSKSSAAILNEVTLSKEELTPVINVIKEVSTENPQEKKTEEEEVKYQEPDVTVGIMSRRKIRFSLNTNYLAKGAIVRGEQEVECSEGGILWNGNLYRELTFTPQEKFASFSLYERPEND